MYKIRSPNHSDSNIFPHYILTVLNIYRNQRENNRPITFYGLSMIQQFDSQKCCIFWGQIKEYIRASILKFILQTNYFYHPTLPDQKACSGTNLISLISSCRFYKVLAQLKILNKYKIIIYNNSDVFLV